MPIYTEDLASLRTEVKTKLEFLNGLYFLDASGDAIQENVLGYGMNTATGNIAKLYNLNLDHGAAVSASVPTNNTNIYSYSSNSSNYALVPDVSSINTTPMM